MQFALYAKPSPGKQLQVVAVSADRFYQASSLAELVGVEDEAHGSRQCLLAPGGSKAGLSTKKKLMAAAGFHLLGSGMSAATIGQVAMAWQRLCAGTLIDNFSLNLRAQDVLISAAALAGRALPERFSQGVDVNAVATEALRPIPRHVAQDTTAPWAW
jgi:hypothetical protein